MHLPNEMALIDDAVKAAEQAGFGDAVAALDDIKDGARLGPLEALFCGRQEPPTRAQVDEMMGVVTPKSDAFVAVTIAFTLSID